MALKAFGCKEVSEEHKNSKNSWSVDFFCCIFSTEIDFFVTQRRFWINSLQPTNPGVKKSHFVPPAFGVWIMSLGPGDGVMVFGCTKTMVCLSALLEQVSKTWAKNTGFWKDFWYLQCFCQRCMQSTRVYSSIFFNPRQNRQFFHCHRARLKMWYHVFYCAWIRRVPPQLKLTLCLWKDTLLHWCGWGLAISAGLATKSLATGAGGHCGQGLFALSSGPWWTDSDSIIIMLDVIDSWIVPLRQPIISSPKDSSERKPEHKNRHQVPPPERLCFQNLRDFLERGFSGGIRSDSRRYLLGNM